MAAGSNPCLTSHPSAFEHAFHATDRTRRGTEFFERTLWPHWLGQPCGVTQELSSGALRQDIAYDIIVTCPSASCSTPQ